MTYWYDTFFDALANDVWAALATPAMTEPEVAFVRRALDRADVAGLRLLDAPCGTGRHALAFAGMGATVVGVDLSADALSRLAGGPVQTVHADLARLGQAVTGPFDGAWCLGNSFGYLDPAGTAAFVGGVASVLRPGARFVIDHPLAAEAALPHLDAGGRHEAGGAVLELSNRYDTVSSTIVSTMTLERGGERAVREVRHRVSTAREVVAVLDGAGFDVVDLAGDLDGKPFTVGDGRLLVTARRR